MKQFKTIYFIYDADGGLWNEIKYWIKKNLLNEQSTCELCDLSHGKIFVRFEWLRFIKELKKEYKVKDYVVYFLNNHKKIIDFLVSLARQRTS